MLATVSGVHASSCENSPMPSANVSFHSQHRFQRTFQHSRERLLAAWHGSKRVCLQKVTRVCKRPCRSPVHFLCFLVIACCFLSLNPTYPPLKGSRGQIHECLLAFTFTIHKCLLAFTFTIHECLLAFTFTIHECLLAFTFTWHSVSPRGTSTA